MRSMTGYGRATIRHQQIKITVEAKTVNHRFFECSIRLPKAFQFLEETLRKMCKTSCQRGKVDLYLSVEGQGVVSRKLIIDELLLKQYVETAEQLSQSLNISAELDINVLLQNEQLALITEQQSDDIELLKTLIYDAVQASLMEMTEMKEIEGKTIEAEFQQILADIQVRMKEIERQAPRLIKQYQERLTKRIRLLLSEDIELEEGRLLTEVALFADKVDITEEISRLASHLNQFRGTCAEDGAVGRKLDFIVQEMNREANTIGAKGSEASIRQQVVEIKSLIEKLKEQVQNVE